jgi:hypothetical protein
MVSACMITGSFTTSQGRPVQGLVRFIPSRLWVVVDNITWACLAPTIQTGRDGSFTAWVTATDNDAVPWTYQVETPAGIWTTYIPWIASGYALPDLLHGHGVEHST